MVKTSDSQKDSHNFQVPATMSVFLAIVFLSLNMGKSGGAIKPVVTFTPNWGNIIHYDDVTLTCDVPSTVPEEPRTYHWYRDKRPIPGDQQRLHIIRSSVGRDRGDYQCQTIGGDISDPVFLDVTHNHVILQRPPSAIYEGDPLTLRCHHIRGFIAINTKFYKDDQEIKSSESDSTFHIPNITRSQSGRYKCTKQIQRYDITNVMEISDESFISVKELFSPPKIKVTPSRVIGGDEMTVRCDTRLDPLRGSTELHFAFYRDGRTVRGYDVSDTYRVPSSQLEDSGKYICEVRTASGTVRKRSDELYIQIYELFSPLKIEVTPSRVIEGDEMTLEDSGKYICEVRTASGTVRKRSDELYIQIYELFSPLKIEVTPSRVIEGDEMTLEDSGKYICEVRTASGTVRKRSDELYIQIYELFSPLKIEVTPSRVIEGDEMTLEDSGNYTCEVRKRSGSVRTISDEIYIQIYGEDMI
ncbi:Fc receptor-like B [Lithobates pipiens]